MVVSDVLTEDADALVIHARALRDQILDHPDDPPPEAETVLAAAIEQGNHLAAALVLNAQAYVHRELLRHPAALTCANQAIDHAGASGHAGELVRAYVGRAMVRLELGQSEPARADLRSAAEIGPLDAALVIATAVVARHAGDLRLARRLLENLLSEKDIPPLERLRALNNLADALMESQPARALELLRAAADLAAEGYAAFLPVVVFNTGLAHAYAGELPQALQQLDLARSLGDRGSALYATEFDSEQARVWGRLRLIAEARAASARALGGISGQASPLLRADSLVTSARLARTDGDRSTAHRLLEEARTLYAQQDRTAGVAVATLELLDLDSGADPAEIARYAGELARLGMDLDAGRAWLRAGAGAEEAADPVAAERYRRQVLRLDDGDPAIAHEAKTLIALASGDRRAACADVAAALDLIDSRAALTSAPDLRHRIAADRAAVEQLHRRCHLAEPATERLDALLRARPPAATRGEASAEQEELRQQWRELARRVESADEDPETLAGLGARLAETERALRATSWAANFSGGGRAAFGLAELREHVGGEILALARAGTDALAFHHEAGATTVTRLASWSDLSGDLAQLARGLSRVASGGGRAAYDGTRALAGELDELLDGTVAADSTEPVLVLLDRGLDGSALGALPRLWRRPLTFASLAVTAPGSGDDAAAADPRVVVATGPRLEYAEAEAARIRSLWGVVEPVTTCADLRSAVPSADVLHVAAHASLRWDNPLQSVIHLHDGPLALTELCHLGRGIRLLYLSACSLASAPSDELLVGAVPMLTEQVAQEVVAASVPLPDEHAPAIAGQVHAVVRGGSTAAAGLALARSTVDPDDPREAARWASLACLAAYTAAP